MVHVVRLAHTTPNVQFKSQILCPSHYCIVVSSPCMVCEEDLESLSSSSAHGHERARAKSYSACTCILIMHNMTKLENCQQCKRSGKRMMCVITFILAKRLTNKVALIEWSASVSLPCLERIHENTRFQLQSGHRSL